MKKSYIFLGVILFLGIAIFSVPTNIVFGQAFNADGDDCFMNPADEKCDVVIYSPRSGGGGMTSGGGSPTDPSPTPSTPAPVGMLNFSPSDVKDGGSFIIKLTGADSLPANTVTRLWIEPENAGTFTNFGRWLTVGELRNGVSRKLSCSSYSSYNPSGPVNINGKRLEQRIFISYEGLNLGSEISSHVKDCSAVDPTPITPAPTTPTGSTSCSVTPGAVSMTQGGTVNMSVSTSRISTASDYVYVTATGFPGGTFSSLATGQVIAAGSNKKDFQIFSTTNATRGQFKFTVYCSTGCPVSGCPSGGTPDVLGSADVAIIVSGNNAEPVVGGGSGGSASGSDACRVSSLIIPPNSSDRVDIGFDGTENNVSFSASASSASGISRVSAYPNVKVARSQNGSGREIPVVRVETGSNFSGQSSYNLACNYSSNSLSAVGVVSAPAVVNSSGKVKLSQMQDIREVLFPSSACPMNVKGCRDGFYSYAPLFVMANATPPALVGTDMIHLNPAPGKGNTAHPKLFNLTDPMRPTDSGLSGQIRAGGDYDTAGDFGPYLAMESAAYSKDKKIWAGTSGQGTVYVWKDGKRYEDWDSYWPKVEGIVQYGFSYILLTQGGQYDISNGMRSVSSGIDELSGNMWRRDALNPAPENFPNIPPGKKIIMGDDKHILSVVDNVSGRSGAKLGFGVYSVDSPNVIVEEGFPSQESGQQKFGTIPTSGGDYIYILKAPKYTGAWSAYGSWKAYVYKFEYSTNKLTKVADGITLAPGAITAYASFGSNTTSPGIAVFSHTQTAPAGGLFGEFDARIRVYLLSDLMQGNGADSMSNSPSWTDQTHTPTSAASLTVGGSTYLYANDSRVYKIELGTASGDTPPPTTPPTGEGTPSTIPTYNCDFDLSFIPADLSVKQGAYSAHYTIKANSPSVNPFCTISVIPPSQNNIKMDYISTLVVSPGGQASMLLNVSKAAKGSYVLPVKAAAKGVPIKTYNINLTVY